MGDVAGEIMVIGTPAEETNGAKVQMAALGVFNDIDVAMAAHPTGEAHHRSGTSQAMEAFSLLSKGKLLMLLELLMKAKCFRWSINFIQFH